MATRSYEDPSPPWPLRLLGWLYSGLLVLTILAITGVTVLVIASSAYYELTRTKSGEVQEMTDRLLPTGSSVDGIYAVLDQQGIEHGVVEGFAGDDQSLLYAGVRTGDPVILATVENEGYSFELVDVQIAFVLDENLALKRTVVYERRYQPEWLDRKLDPLNP